ncbi:MAG: STAS/SEC14 domain-containing protein [Pyrinomonadaceae bacterium]
MVNFLHLEIKELLAFHLSGTVSAEDIDLIADSLEEKFDRFDEVNLYIEIDDSLEESFGGILEQAKKGFSVILPNLGKIKKAALVSDKAWLRKITDFKDLFFTMEMKGFSSPEKEEAFKWVVNKNETQISG